ncbi:uncharacterized protein [Amphiura filiformis]|uniref:uncharacterized protein n=1 Tax=Amphiura filiformis TaxID=82378 RepID=UPI003B20ECE1
MTLNAAKSTTGLWYVEDRLLVMQMTASAWYVLCATNAATLYYVCSTDKLPEFFNAWQKYYQSAFKSRTFGTCAASVNRRKTLILVGAICFILSNSLFTAFSRFGPVESLQNDTYFLVAPTIEPVLVWEVFAMFSMISASAAFVLPSALLLIFCSIIAFQFYMFTKRFHNCMTKESRFKGCLMSLRRQHQYLSKAVFLLDETFSFYLAVNFGAVIFVACFLMYQLVVAQSYKSTMTTLLTLFWFGTASMTFALIGVLTAQVPEKAHDIANYIHDIGVFGFKEHEEVTQMSMFMAKLNGAPISLTLWGIVPLTKEFLLTVVGVYITYFALVAQSF